MKHKAKHLLAAFALGVILILALAGFLAVDLSAGRDMPGEYRGLFRLSDIRPDGMTADLFGRRYYFLPERLEGIKAALWELRSLLPAEARAAGFASTRLIAGGTGSGEQ